MKYKAILNEDGYIEELQEDGDVEVNLEETRIHPLFCFKVVDNKTVYDEERYNYLIQKEKDKQEIAELKQKLADTDYIHDVILEGDATTEDYAEVIANRKQWRARVRELEK